MEYRDVQWVWAHFLICSSIIQATTVSPLAKGDSSVGNSVTYIYSTKTAHDGRPNPPSSSSSLLPEISTKDSTDDELVTPGHSGMFPWYPGMSSSERPADFSGDDGDLVFDDEDMFTEDGGMEREDKSDDEQVEQNMFESAKFIFRNASVPSVQPAEAISTFANSLLKPLPHDSTAVYIASRSHNVHTSPQGSGTALGAALLQNPTTFPNDGSFFEATSRHATLPHTGTVRTTPRPLVTREAVNPTLASDHLVSGKQRLVATSDVPLRKGKPVLEIERNRDQTTPPVSESSPPAKWDQTFISKKLAENRMTPAPMRSASPWVTGSSYAAMKREKSLIVSQPIPGRNDRLGAVNGTVTVETNARHTANGVEHTHNLPTTSATEKLVSEVRWQTTGQVYASVKVLSDAHRMSTSQWTTGPVHGAGRFLPAQQTTQTYLTSERGYDVLTNRADNTSTLVEMLKDAQLVNGRPTDINQGSTLRGTTSLMAMNTISPTARLQHLTMKGNRNGMSPTEPPRAVTAAYLSPLTAWRLGPSGEVNSALEPATTLRTERTPSGRYMAMLKTGPTVLAQGLSAKVSNKANVSATQTPLVQEGPGTKSMGTNLSLPRATTKAPLPSYWPTKMPEAWTSTRGGAVKPDVTPPLKGTVTEQTSLRATGTPGIYYNIVTTVKGGHSGTATQTPTMKGASNNTAGVNTTSLKDQGPRNGPGRRQITPIHAQKPNHTADSRTTAGSRSNKISSHFELCPTQDRDCAINKTFIHWKDMKRTLGFAWELHIYGAGVLFVVLMVISLINLIGSPILYIPDLGYLMAAHAVLFVLAFLRALYLFLDPYGSKAILPLVSGLVLYNITFPLLVTTFGILTLLLLKMGSLQMLSPKLQSPTALTAIASAHFVVLMSGDLLCLLVNPAVNVVLHVFSVSWASFLFAAYFLSYRKLKSRPEASLQPMQKSAIGNEEPVNQQIQGRALRQLLISTRVMAISAVLGFLCCALQLYATLWNYGLLGKKGQFYWTWWFLQFWYRSFEIAMSFAMSFVASYTFCQQHARPGHTCWRKIVQYFHHYRKSEVRDYPNNCFDWSYGTQDRVTSNDICKNLLRNHSESVPLKAMNGTNGANPAKSYLGNNGSIVSLDHRPKIPVLGPKSHNLLIGRSFTSICIEKESAVSLTELDLRPPSPINLSRSIDEALFREHIVRDSLFNNASLRHASRLAIEDSRSSLRVPKASDQAHAAPALQDFRRRNSDPDCLYNMAKSSSLNNNQMDTSKQSIQELDSTQAPSRLHRSASGSSLDSLSRTSFGIHWYTWTREHSSEESVPSADPASESLLSQDKSLDNPDVTLKSEDLDLEAQKSFIEIRVIDDVSLSSDTIEL
ncbi:uncharacterized protein LOC144601747 [Rhinoraja longicauda]